MTIKETTLKEALNVHFKIPEFENSYDKQTFQERLEGKKHFILVALEESNPIGYLISYEENPKTIYHWMAGVVPKYRREGALKLMMDKMNSIAKTSEYTKVTIKTRNDKRGMLFYLLKDGYNFTEVEKIGNVEDYRIYLEKELR